jgi:large subunit ribosomal protein L24
VSTKIRKGDTVEVISGRREEIGKRGEVIKVMPQETRLVVQGVNVRKKHQVKATQQGCNLPLGISN